VEATTDSLVEYGPIRSGEIVTVGYGGNSRDSQEEGRDHRCCEGRERTRNSTMTHNLTTGLATGVVGSGRDEIRAGSINSVQLSGRY
jgi:hypothetical protein